MTSINNSTNNTVKLNKKETEIAFLKRIDEKLTQLCNGNILNTRSSPFSLWLQAYVLAIKVKFTVFHDDDYNLLKSRLGNKSAFDTLPTYLKQVVRRNHLHVRKISVLDQRSTSFRPVADECSVSKEVISLQRNGNKSKENQNLDDNYEEEFNLLNIPYKVVIPLSKIEQTLKKIHSTNGTANPEKDHHLAINKTETLVYQYFLGIPRLVIRQFVKRCKQCQVKKIVTEKEIRRQRFLHVLPEGSVFERLELDLFSLECFDETLEKRISTQVVQAADHHSKFRFAKVIPNKESQHVVGFLESLFAIIGPPRYLQSDNGGEFVNENMVRLASFWNCTLINSSPIILKLMDWLKMQIKY